MKTRKVKDIKKNVLSARKLNRWRHAGQIKKVDGFKDGTPVEKACSFELSINLFRYFCRLSCYVNEMRCRTKGQRWTKWKKQWREQNLCLCIIWTPFLRIETVQQLGINNQVECAELRLYCSCETSSVLKLIQNGSRFLYINRILRKTISARLSGLNKMMSAFFCGSINRLLCYGFNTVNRST